MIFVGIFSSSFFIYLPADFGSFCRLHKYVDAGTLGDLRDVFFTGSKLVFLLVMNLLDFRLCVIKYFSMVMAWS